MRRTLDKAARVESPAQLHSRGGSQQVDTPVGAWLLAGG